MPCQRPAPPETQVVLHIARGVRDVRVGARGDTGGRPSYAGVKTDVDFAVVIIGSASQHGRDCRKLVGTRVLHVRALLQARVMLLSGIAIDGVVQVIREIGIEIEERRGTGT